MKNIFLPSLVLILALSGCGPRTAPIEVPTGIADVQYEELNSLLARAGVALALDNMEEFYNLLILEEEKYVEYRLQKEMTSRQLEEVYEQKQAILINTLFGVEMMYERGEYDSAYELLSYIPAKPPRTTPPTDREAWTEAQRLYGDIKAKLEAELYVNPRTLASSWPEYMGKEISIRNIAVTKNDLENKRFTCKMIDASSTGYDSDVNIYVDYGRAANLSECIELSASQKHKIEVEVNGRVVTRTKTTYMIQAAEIIIWD